MSQFLNVKSSCYHFLLMAVSCLTILSTQVFANNSETVAITEPQNWVEIRKPIQPKTIPVDDITNGIFYQLLDRQIKIEKNGEKSSYSRYIERIVNHAGVDQSSQINLDYDPSYQTLTLHSLFIIRNGEYIDKLHSAKMSVFNRETELAKQIYNGSLTLNILIDDIQVGDVLDYSYTRNGANPVYQGLFSYQRNLNWSVPVLQQFTRILWGKNKPLHTQVKNLAKTVSTKKIGEYTEYQIALENETPLKTPSQVPGWYNPYGVVYFDETKSWSDVVAWAQPLYQFSNIHPNITDIADNIREEYSEPDQQIVAALQFSQNNIRYVGLEMGQNSHLPTAPEETLALKYGDCKDKAVLFIAILKALNISAYPALVDTDQTKALIDIPAGVNRFNHVIVTLDFEGEKIWLDPTLSHQKGNLNNVFQPNYGYALVLKAGENALTQMQTDPALSYTHITESYFIPADAKQVVPFNVSSEYKGSAALNKSQHLEGSGKTKVSKEYEVYYQDFYASLTANTEIISTTNSEAGTISIAEDYSIEKFWKLGKEHYEMEFYPSDIRNAVFKPKQVNRDAPLAFKFPNNIKNVITLEFEEDGWDFTSKKVESDNEFFKFTSDIQFKNKILTLTYDYSAKTDQIPHNKIEDYLAARDSLRSNAYYAITKYIKTTESQTVEQEDNVVLMWIGIIAIVYLLVLLVIIVNWRIESRKRPKFTDSEFYPMSLSKFLILSISTFGIYTAYWVYRNWKAIQQKNNLNIMPIARGIFNVFWFYPLFSALKKHSEERYETNKVMMTSIAVLFAITYFVTSALSNAIEVYWFTLVTLFLPLLFIPLVNYINQVNPKDSAAYSYNSTWYARQIAAVVLCAPILLFTVLSETPFIPSDKVVTEDRMLSSDLQFLYRQQVLPADETIHYFYSDAFLSARDDGNGFTDNRVFSYWLDEQDKFEKQVATYDEIANIDVKYSKDDNTNTVITITRNDESTFMLFVARNDKGDERFIDKLKLKWQQQNTP